MPVKSARACSNCVAFIESSKSVKMDKRRVTLLADPTHAGSLGFERKCRQSWLAQFSSGISNKGELTNGTRIKINWRVMNWWVIITKQMAEGMNKSINEQISCDREMNKESTQIKHERTND